MEGERRNEENLKEQIIYLRDEIARLNAIIFEKSEVVEPTSVKDMEPIRKFTTVRMRLAELEHKGRLLAKQKNEAKNPIGKEFPEKKVS